MLHSIDMGFKPSYIVPAVSHRIVTNPACASRLLMTEHQVPQQVSSLEQLLKQPHVTRILDFLVV
ncbi:MAG: hypothetical protein RR676_13380 [Acinetobacter sp.]